MRCLMAFVGMNSVAARAVATTVGPSTGALTMLRHHNTLAYPLASVCQLSLGESSIWFSEK